MLQEALRLSSMEFESQQVDTHVGLVSPYPPPPHTHPPTTTHLIPPVPIGPLTPVPGQSGQQPAVGAGPGPRTGLTRSPEEDETAGPD
jgi:hypothetical protein